MYLSRSSVIQVSSTTCPAEDVHVPNHFCMLPSVEHILYGIAGFIAQFEWQRAVIITEIDNPLRLVSYKVDKLPNSYSMLYQRKFILCRRQV